MRFSEEDRVIVTNKDRTCVGLAGTITQIPEDDNIVYVQLDVKDDVIWFIETELEFEFLLK